MKGNFLAENFEIMNRSAQFGNALIDRKEFKQWFVGPFIPESLGLRHTSGVEIKWGCHTKGETREQWAQGGKQATISILVRGKFRLRFRSPHDGGTVTEYVLEKEGDYVIWPPKVDHTWSVEEDCVILTVRWEDQADVPTRL